ncbi:MAG: hypothetical protein ACI4SC_04345 [Candidatus Neoclostridium sp.]
MQDFYGNTPFILGSKNRTKRKKRDKTVSLGINGRFIARITLLSLLALTACSFIVFRTAYTVSAQGGEYYCVCFYDGQSKTEAEKTQSDLIASGGSGYVICSGSYKVYGGVYATKAQAEKVAARQSGSTVETIGWEKKRIGFSSRSEAALTKEALSFYSDTVGLLVRRTEEMSSGEQSSVAVKTLAATAQKRLNEYSAKLSRENLSVLFERAAVSVGRICDCEQSDTLSVLRFAAQDLIVLRKELF